LAREVKDLKHEPQTFGFEQHVFLQKKSEAASAKNQDRT
jgi:hypothetical protein